MAVAMLFRPEPCDILACSGLLQPLRHKRRHLEDKNRRRGLHVDRPLIPDSPDIPSFSGETAFRGLAPEPPFLERDL